MDKQKKIQKNIQSRWRLINNLFVLLIILVLLILVIREYQVFQTNIDYFNENLHNSALHEIKHEVDNRVDEIDSVKEKIDTEFHNSLRKVVKDVDFFAEESIKYLDPTATLEEKRSLYIDTIYQYDIYENEYLFFAMDLDGNSYLSGLTKNLEGTNISNIQDAVTGSYFVLDMIEIINTSPDKQGFITYYWMKEVGGEHIKKTTFIYYNEELELFIGTGLYEIDYIKQVQDELFNRIGSYYTDNEDYVYLVSYTGEIIFHPNENFNTESYLALEIDGESFHETILNDLTENESIYREYYFDFGDVTQLKTAYIKKIDDWDMYIGKSFVFENLEIEQQEYFDSLIVDFIIFNIIVLLSIFTFVVAMKILTNKNFKDVQIFFTQQNDKVKEASYRDVLTGLYNRNYFDYALEKIYGDNQKITIFMIDANGLKLINDIYGHNVGDELLIALSNTLTTVFTDGTIFRWGGDEFIVLLSNDERDQKTLIDDFHKLSSTVKIKNIELSASIGFAVSSDKKVDTYTLINEAEVMMYKNKTLESLSLKRNLIDNLLQTLYSSFDFEEEHSKNVMKYSLEIGNILNISKDDLDKLRLAALLHDVGKIGISDKIIYKKTELTAKEKSIIEEHAEKGMRILSANPELSEYGKYSFAHHERFDGSGYPRGLKGEQIPLFSRIISIAEAYDSMISERPYRKTMSKEKAILEIKKYSGTQFDPKIAKIFIDKVLNKTPHEE